MAIAVSSRPSWNLLLRAAALVWLIAVVMGVGLLMRYDASPGHSGEPPPRWPDGSVIVPEARTKTLIMAVHPRCPCTGASLSELEQVLARCQGRVRAHVLFVSPAGTGPEWRETPLWRQAGSIRDVDVTEDGGGLEARRFGIMTSGHALLFDETGALRFSGGITASRGHAGDNAGRASLVALVEGRPPMAHVTAVYGCGLVDPGPSRKEDALCCR